MRRQTARLAVVAFLLASCMTATMGSSGISVPGDPMLGEFGLRMRCVEPRDSSCTDRALGIAEAMLVQLGAALPPADAAEPLRVPFTIQVDHDPAWEWRSSDGSGGSTTTASIELEPFLAGRGDALMRIDGDDPPYAIPAELTQQLLDALFVPRG